MSTIPLREDEGRWVPPEAKVRPATDANTPSAAGRVDEILTGNDRDQDSVWEDSDFILNRKESGEENALVEFGGVLHMDVGGSFLDMHTLEEVEIVIRGTQEAIASLIEPVFIGGRRAYRVLTKDGRKRLIDSATVGPMQIEGTDIGILSVLKRVKIGKRSMDLVETEEGSMYLENGTFNAVRISGTDDIISAFTTGTLIVAGQEVIKVMRNAKPPCYVSVETLELLKAKGTDEFISEIKYSDRNIGGRIVRGVGLNGSDDICAYLDMATGDVLRLKRTNRKITYLDEKQETIDGRAVLKALLEGNDINKVKIFTDTLERVDVGDNGEIDR